MTTAVALIVTILISFAIYIITKTLTNMSNKVSTTPGNLLVLVLGRYVDKTEIRTLTQTALISLCVLLMLFSVDHLISWLDGTVMSVGRSSSSHAHLQTFQNSCRPVYWNFVKCVLKISWKSVRLDL